MEIKISVKDLNLNVQGKAGFEMKDFLYEGKVESETAMELNKTLGKVFVLMAAESVTI